MSLVTLTNESAEYLLSATEPGLPPCYSVRTLWLVGRVARVPAFPARGLLLPAGVGRAGIAAASIGVGSRIMVTSTRARAGQRHGKGSRQRERRPSPIERGRLAVRWVRDIPSRLPSLSIADRRHRELAGVALLLICALSAWSLVPRADAGLIPAWWADILTSAYGTVGSWVIPLLLGLASIRFLRPTPGPVLVARHYAGGLFLTVSAVGLLRLGDNSRGTGLGGNAGAAVATLATEGLGEVPAAIFLLILGWVAVLLLAGTSAHVLVSEVHGAYVRGRDALRTRRSQRPPPHAEPSPEPPAPDAPAPDSDPPTRRRIRARSESAVEPSPVVAAVTDDEVIPGLRAVAAPAMVERVINIPKREPPVSPLPDTDPAKAARRARLAVPMPLPSTGLLAQYDGVPPDTAGLETKARLIEESLRSFRVDARVREINPGPSVTQFALEPGGGVKVRRITELQNDLALALAAPSIRIEAPIPGFARVGLEIPNDEISTVGLRETLESAAFARGKQKLPIPLGRDVNGRYVVHDLTRMPHLLIAGATGSGKSVCLNGIISTFLLCRAPDELKILMIDPKMVELTLYNGVPHLQCPVVTEMDKVVGALRLVLREMERRYAMFSKLGVRNLDGYRLKTEDESDAERLPYLVVIIDELADLMMTAPIEVEALLVRLAQMARATGIHLILATQRPSVNVLTGLIKANVPARIAFAVSSGVDSRVVLDMPGAERLLGRGDMLFLPPDAAKPQRVQGAYIEDGDVQKIVAHWHAVAPVPAYAQEWLELPTSSRDDAIGGGGGDEEDDPLMDQALEVVRQQGTASASMLQRRLRIGYNRAARLIEQMEEEGVIGPADGVKGRPLLLGSPDLSSSSRGD